jgi:hypothetical protein
VNASQKFKEYLLEEMFFFKYFMKIGREEFLKYPITERKWFIDRFIRQKEKEHDELQKSRKKH